MFRKSCAIPEVTQFYFINSGTYKDGMSPNGYTLSDHMTLASVVATILILDNTAQVCEHKHCNS